MSAWHRVAWGMARRILDLALPRACLGCDRPGEPLLCSECAHSLPPRLPPGAVCGIPVYSAYPYACLVGEAVQRLKYRGRPDLAAPLGQLVANGCSRFESLSFDLVVPVPLHPRRLAARGYNQSYLIARELGRSVGVRCESRALERIRDTRQQARLEAGERRHNVAGAFMVRYPAMVARRRVLIVDDVVTSGATALGCADVLQRARATVVGIASPCGAR